MLIRNHIYETKICDYTTEGQGVAKIEGCTVFIPNAIVGETVTVRIGADDPLPCEDFLFTIGQDCQYLIDEEVAGIDMYCLTDDCLDETGNVTSGIAAKLAATYLGVEETALTGGETSVDGLYTFSAGENACTVDAFTGLVAAA